MCFGNMTTSQQQNSTQTSTPPAWLSNAAQNNVNFASNLQTGGFTPYSGQQVANFAPQQQQSFGLGGQVAGSVTPYVGEAGGLISNYANAGPQSVSPETIASQMSPYMNQYVQQALAPQIEAQNQQFAGQNKAFDAGATSAGAYGDTGWGLGKSNLTQQQDIARQGLVGNAYNAAFNTAIGAGAQDVANNLSGQTTNANLAETALGRQLTGGNALFGQGTGATNLINTLGAQQTGQSQAQLNALYNQWLLAQQYPFQTTQLVNSTLGAARGAVPTTTTGTSTTQAPDNSGWGLLGAGMPAMGKMLGSGIGGLGSMFGIGGGAAAGAGAAGAGAAADGTAAAAGAAGAGAAADGTAAAVGAGLMDALPAALAFLADGGTPPVGQPSVVGERGPELFVPGASGVVVPNEILEAAREKRAQKLAAAPGIARALGLAA